MGKALDGNRLWWGLELDQWHISTVCTAISNRRCQKKLSGAPWINQICHECIIEDGKPISMSIWCKMSRKMGWKIHKNPLNRSQKLPHALPHLAGTAAPLPTRKSLSEASPTISLPASIWKNEKGFEATSSPNFLPCKHRTRKSMWNYCEKSLLMLRITVVMGSQLHTLRRQCGENHRKMYEIR